MNDVVLLYPDISGQDVAVPLTRLAELWVTYYWPFADARAPIYQGGRAVREEEGGVRNDVGFRPALTQLRLVWEEVVQLSTQPADGFFLLTEMRTPRRRATYPLDLQQAYQQTVSAMVKALQRPIKYAGLGEWAVFVKPRPCNQAVGTIPLPGTQPMDSCVIIPASLWEAFQRLSLYVEALCLHEWALFTEQVMQDRAVGRGLVFSLLTARPDNRRPLSWERNQVDILLHEQVVFTCPWTLKRLTEPQDYDLDHLLPLAVYLVNELWSLLLVDRTFNQQVKRNKVPDAGRLAAAEPWLAAAYGTYLQAPALQRAVREDAALRFAGLEGTDFAAALASHAVRFIDAVAVVRYVRRF